MEHYLPRGEETVHIGIHILDHAHVVAIIFCLEGKCERSEMEHVFSLSWSTIHYEAKGIHHCTVSDEIL